MIHIVNKGKTGEREVCTILRDLIDEVIIFPIESVDHELVDKIRGIVQRNQNQSAEGGGDINLFGLSIEVKRQETLSVEAWWKQTCASAERNGDKPILMYRQNNKKWHVVMETWLALPNQMTPARATINLESFKEWFKLWVVACVKNGEIGRV